MNDDFYIGWEEQAPSGHQRVLRRFVFGLAAVTLVLAIGLASAQRLIGVAFFEWTEDREFAGVLRAGPAPYLESFLADGSAVSHLLVAPWKFGFSPESAREFDGQRVRLRGKRIHRDNRVMIEVAPGTVVRAATGETPTPSSVVVPLGTRRLVGEIVDSKCWLGVMNPGRMTPHRACAVRCISGGIPPILLVQHEGGRTEHYLLTGSDGRPLNKEILGWIAEPVEITGQVERRGDLLVLRTEPEQIVRIGAQRW